MHLKNSALISAVIFFAGCTLKISSHTHRERGGAFISGLGNYWNKLQQKTQDFCSGQSNKLLSLLNLLCNTTQTTSVQSRDACYGCFFRAGSLPGGPTQLTSLSQCANLYISESPYAPCARDLALVANGSVPTAAPTTSGCYTGYCEFVRCVRRMNANRLVDQCFLENMPGRNFSVMAQRIFFYGNVTSCILARSRCGAYNPISGELQTRQMFQQYGKGFGGVFGTSLLPQVTYNSLQIASTGDIRLVSFPGTVSVGELFCSRISTLEQSGYGTDVC